jgi:hypothetical protein
VAFFVLAAEQGTELVSSGVTHANPDSKNKFNGRDVVIPNV